MNSNVLRMKKTCEFGGQKCFYRAESPASLTNGSILRMKKNLRVRRTEVFYREKSQRITGPETLSAVK